MGPTIENHPNPGRVPATVRDPGSREVLERSLAELQSQVERHQTFMRRMFEGRPEMAGERCPWADCRHRRRLCQVMIEAVRVLEETRKAFKSKQLELLRKEFIRVLQEEMQG
jgi:hypothetical protein